MAGEWIAVEIDLRDKPEVWAIAEALRLDPDAVVGKLIRVWGWFDKQTRDGHARRVTFAVLDDKSGVIGFAAAMENEGWLIRTDDGIQMPKFDEFHGKSAKTRLLGTRRKQAQRAREEDLPPAPPAPPPPERPANVAKVSRTERDKTAPETGTTGQDSNNTEQEKEHVESDDSTLSPFERFWKAYPSKVAKPITLAKWKQKKLDECVKEILADITARKAGSGKWLDGIIPNPSTYLHQERWKDPIDPPRKRAANAPDPDGGKLTQVARRLFEGGNDDHPNAPGNYLEHDG